MAERELLVRILGDDRDLQRALGNTERRLASIDSRTAAFGKNIRTAFAAAGISVGIASFSRGMQEIVQSSIEFEEAFAGVRKTVDASETELAALSDGIRQLSREIPLTVTELARIAEAAGQLGVAKANILEFTRTVADLAATTDLSADTAAESFARFTNITGLPQDQVSNLGSAVVDLGNKLAATESEILDFATRIAGAGRQAGLTDAQIVAVAGAFRSVGVESEVGGTAVQKVLLSMTSAALSGGKQLQLFANIAGQSVEEFRRAFAQDSGAAFATFVEGLEGIRQEGGNVFKTLEALGFSDQRLVRAFLSMSSNSALLTDSLRIGNTAFTENVALTEEAEKRYATTGSQLQIFKNRANDAAISVGDALAPGLLDAADAAEVLIDGLRLIPDALQAIEDAVPGAKTSLLDLFGIDVEFDLGTSGIDIIQAAFGGGGGDDAAESIPGDISRRRDLAKKAAVAAREAAQETLKADRDVRRSNRAFSAFVKGMGLKLDKAQLTAGLSDDLAALRELERAIQRRIESEGKTFKLVQLLTDTRLQISALVEQQADDARQAGEDAFNSTVDALNLNLEMAQATESLADDQKALRAIESALLRRIAAEGQTTELLRQLFNVREQQKRVAEQLREQTRERRQGRQFEALGLTEEGDRPTPGAGALRRRLNNIREQIKGTVLDTEKTRRELDRIAAVLSGQFGAVGKNVREAILQMFNDISSALEGGDSRRGPLTRTSGLNTKKILEGLGLSDEEINALRGRLSSINSAGQQLAGLGGPAPSRNRVGLRDDSGGNRIFVESHTTINLDGQQVAKVVTKQQQKTKRRNPKQKRGPNRNI